MKKILAIVLYLVIISSALFATGTSEKVARVVNVYSHRHYDADQDLFDLFTKQTGIQVNLVQASADALIERLRAEGDNSPADLLITVDASRLHRAQGLGLLQPVTSAKLEAAVPPHLRDADGLWYGLTKRARVIAVDKSRLQPKPMDYADLADPRLRGSVLIRSSSNVYNISLLSSIIANVGAETALEWARGVRANMAREPQGNDRDQMKALVAGLGDYAVVNTYYAGLLLNSADAAERQVGEKIGIIFPNQNGRGSHVNISGAGVTVHAPHPEHAILLLEFLTGKEAQKIYADQNHEYPVRTDVALGKTVASWGSFVEDPLSLASIGDLNDQALRIFDAVDWK